MTYFFVGTVAELIKIFPVMIEYQGMGKDYRVIATGQNEIRGSELLTTFGLRDVDISLSPGFKAKNAVELLSWFVRTYQAAKKTLKGVVQAGDVFVIHGDTVSTLMGALLAHKFHLRVAHIEAGLRSFNFLNPFPEEIDRVLASRYVDLAFCPNEWAVGNLKRKKHIRAISTGHNSLIDALAHAVKVPGESQVLQRTGGKPFFVFVMHRNENLGDRALVESMLERVIQKSATTQCVFILHHVTQVVLEQYGLMGRIEECPTILTTGRLGYFEMMKVLSASSFVITDGGSNQEECYYLGKPCCVLRKATERIEGLDTNVVLSLNDPDTIAQFLENPEKFRFEPIKPELTPSRLIAQELAQWA